MKKALDCILTALIVAVIAVTLTQTLYSAIDHELNNRTQAVKQMRGESK